MLTAQRAQRDPDTTDLPESLFSSIDFTHGAVVAISGGGDSTALLLILKKYLDRTAPRTRLLAVTVDHELRPDSGVEAQAVARLCASFGVEHQTLPWSGAKPTTGLPAAAREARYRLLAKAARQAGIGMILTGHTADDQAETVSMRQVRTDGTAPLHGRGLAGMAPATLYDWSTWIVRPLLGTRRAALRDFLLRENIGWIEDPTNTDEHYERPRIRAALDRNSQRFAGIIATATHQAAEREAIGRRAAALICSSATKPAPGLIWLDPAFATGDRSAAIAALRILLATVGGVSFPPDEARTAALIGKLAAAPLCATLSRTLIDARQTGIFLHRERRGLPDVSRAIDGMIWDGRYRIKLQNETDTVLIEPLGPQPTAELSLPENGTPVGLMRAAYTAEPAFRPGMRHLALSPADMPEAAIVPVVAPFARFLPSFDLDLAEAVASLVGAPALSAPPLSSPRVGKQGGKA